jgi:hypothetical protein
MHLTPYQLQTLWSWVLSDLPHRKAGFFIESLIAPGAFWLFGAAFAGFGSLASRLRLFGLAFLALVGLASAVLQTIWTSRSASRRRLTRALILVHQAYYSLMILTTSLYCLTFLLEFGRRQESPFYSWIIALYLASIVAGALWAPHSFPEGPEDLRLAAERES